MRWPAKLIVPARTGSTPVIERRVVVFPTPFRPINATTSPARTSRSTPRRIREPPMKVSTAESERRVDMGGRARREGRKGEKTIYDLKFEISDLITEERKPKTEMIRRYR